MHRDDKKSAVWQALSGHQPYAEILARMQAHVLAIQNGNAPESVWVLEHSPVITQGITGKRSDLIKTNIPVMETDRGGQLTYHGPGQRVAYVMLNLAEREKDIRKYVQTLEAWIIDTLAQFDVVGERREGRIGVWVAKPDGSEAKIAALGVKVRKWVSYHGISLNVNPNLGAFTEFVPCGIRDHGVTSLHDLGRPVTMAEVDQALRQTFERHFGSVQTIT